MRYFEDFVRPAKPYRRGRRRARRRRSPTCATGCAAWDGPADAEALQNLVSSRSASEHGFEPLRAWFAALYEVLLGAEQGPRFGGFIALYGVPETVALIDAGAGGAAGRPREPAGRGLSWCCSSGRSPRPPTTSTRAILAKGGLAEARRAGCGWSARPTPGGSSISTTMPG